MAAATVLSLDSLPSDPLLLILSFLDFRDLVSCSLVSRRLNDLTGHNPLWRRLCLKHWLLTEADKEQRGQSWCELFQDFYSDLGRYIDYYSTLKKAWDELKSYLGQKCPRMIASLKEGAKEEELDAIESQIDCKLPNDYRCSYRIHNGQKLVVPGLMGSMALSNHYRSEDLLDIETAAGGFQQRKGMRQCLPLTFCFHTGLSQYMALESTEGRMRSEIFYHCPDQLAQDPSAIDMFITGSNFTEWFTSYVQNVVTGEYPIIRDQIFRYVHDKKCVATTDNITVSVSTSFLPELSSVHPPHFFFTYRIRIEMAKSALPESACQLDSRYWKITNANGNVEEVRGPGVVGEFPVMTPGKVHEYASCTTFSTTSEYMEGHYTFHRLKNKAEVFDVTIPRFHMVCPPFRESVVRSSSVRELPSAVFNNDNDTDNYEGELHDHKKSFQSNEQGAADNCLIEDRVTKREIKDCRMKLSVEVGLVFVLALIGLGSAIKCYSCIDYTGSCTQTSNCAAHEDGCLTLKERHGKIYRQCVRYSDCTFSTLGSMFSKVSNFNYECCNQDLCNSASLSATRTSVIALILSLALFWCCIF
ncbi:F-box only protein 3 [Bagarius yarrelli]|uniref:MAC-inhibitory protein n=1 Tax=Bagarius yarrelli TaxID=175774 RepID=A0A556V074_BAGYA|nr:F-box only protein 3 [Bagarius yarrelli]